MYELARVRLHSVGPRGARYQDVVLDLRGAGPVISRPLQEALFALDPDPAGGEPGLLRRPSPATVLFLENGGGKSVLLKLIFSVMLPFRRQVVGTTNTRVLEKFVLAQDVAHVMLEWQHTGTGQRVVTGKVSAWRDHVVSADPNRLSEAWYSFRPTAAFNLDTVPVTEHGRLVSVVGFHDRLTEAHKREPELQAVWLTGREAWLVNLTNLGLDPELFGYQRRMNAGEGEAADVFTFRTDEAFVDWLLTAVTSEDDPRGLGELVAGYATRLAQRQTLQDERDFVDGALRRITPLAQAAGEAEQAAAGYRHAHRAAERFAAALAARVSQEQARLTQLDGLVEESADAERTADQHVRRLNRVLLELRRLVAGMRARQAEQARERLKEELDRARDQHQAWLGTEQLVRHAAAREQVAALRAVVREQEAEAAPVLQRRNQAAQRLARGLLGAAKTAEAQASSYGRQAGALAERAAAASAAAEAAVAEAATLRQQADQANRHVDAVRAAVGNAVTEGVLADAEADVPAAAAQATTDLAAARSRYAEARTELGRLASQRQVAYGRRRQAEPLRRTRAATADEASRQLAAAERDLTALADDDRLTGLLGVAEVRPDSDTPTLLELLTTAIEDATTEQTGLRMAEAADERALTALGTGGLLPPAEELTEAVRALESAGIAAWAGWQFLAEAAPGERERMLATYPHLVDGIVLNRPDQLDRAEQVLARARLLPRAVVAVGATATMTELAAPPPAGLAFLVEPNPALYDLETAARERDRLLEARAQRRARLATLDQQLAGDRRLQERLTSWRAAYPAGRVDELRQAHEQAQQALAQADAALASADVEVTELDQAEQELRDSLERLHAAEAAATSRAERLATLAAQVAQLAGWQAEVRTARTAASKADAAADGHREEAGRLREQAQTARLTAGDHRRTAASCREEVGGIAGAGDVDESAPVPPEPVAELRSAYRAAASAYEQVQVGADLRAALDQAEAQASATWAAVERLAPHMRELAAALLASPDGADAPSRVAATERAERATHDVEGRHSQQLREEGRLKNDYERMPKQEVSLEPYGQPTGIAHGEQLAARVEADWDAARSSYEEIQGRLDQLRRQATGIQEAVRGFTAQLEALAAVVSGDLDPETEPFVGGDAAARERRVELMSALADARRQHDETERAVRGATDALASYATEERFEKVSSPVRRQITTVERERLPSYAEEWERALRPRLRTLEDDLAQIEGHRASIVERLRGMVQQALRTLHSVQRLSKLPEGLGDWRGQEFLRIRFTEPEPVVLTERLGGVIDGAVTTGEGKGGGKRDGLSLLLRGVQAAMAPKGVRVEMLKPDAVLRTERVRVAEIGDVFSGGQLLTAAIILYCTMANLRANERGYTRRPHAGVLFLDNPIGRASAGYLLELQLKVAEALNVQLIYTTGLFDVNALSVFPLIIRLRNDADLRAGLKYLSVEEHLTAALGRLPEPDGTATVTGTRLFRRPAPPQRSAA